MSTDKDKDKEIQAYHKSLDEEIKASQVRDGKVSYSQYVEDQLPESWDK